MDFFIGQEVTGGHSLRDWGHLEGLVQHAKPHAPYKYVLSE